MELDRRHLRSIHAVAFHRNVTQAAARLGVTQPALSRAIREIERVLGLALIERVHQGMLPTASCLELLERARPLLAEFEALDHTVHRLGGTPTGELAIGLGPAVTAGSAPLEIVRVLAAFPGLRCRAITASGQELRRALEQFEVEFCVADLAPLERADTVSEGLTYTGTLFCRADHPVLRAPETLARHPIALLGPPAEAVDAVRAILRERDPTVSERWQPALTLNDAGALTALLLASDLIGGSAAYAHATALRDGRLREIPLSRPVYEGRVGAVRLRARRLSAAAEQLWKQVLEGLRSDLGDRPGG